MSITPPRLMLGIGNTPLSPLGKNAGRYLNPYRGRPFTDTQRRVGKRGGERGKPVKVANNGWLRQSSIRASGLGLVTPSHRTESPSVIYHREVVSERNSIRRL